MPRHAAGPSHLTGRGASLQVLRRYLWTAGVWNQSWRPAGRVFGQFSLRQGL